MGRTGSGVEIRGNSIRLIFRVDGQRVAKMLKVNGQALAPTKANLKHAERVATEIREKIRLGIFTMSDYFTDGVDPQQGATVADQLEAFMDTLVAEHSTKAGYSSAVKFWKSAQLKTRKLGEVPLRHLKYSDILTAIAARPDLTGKTINNYVTVLREALELAVKDRVLSDNPGAKVPRQSHQKDPPDPFSREESDKIIAKFAERHPGQAANMAEFWFWTGLRTSEIFGLKWDNVDLASGSILVAEANVRGQHKDRTKTNTARTVKLNSKALSAIERQKQHTYLAGAEVFQDPRYLQAWVDERAFRRSFWTPVLKSLGIRYRRPYNMRHSYATALLMAGANHAWCAKHLGHSIEMFQRTYAKWIDGEQNDREMEKLELTIVPTMFPRNAEKSSK